MLGYGIENLCYYEEVTVSEYVFLLAVARELDHSGSRLMFPSLLIGHLLRTVYVLRNDYAHEILSLCISNLR